MAASPKLEVYAHRGLRAHRPENTLPGYAAMLLAGAHFADMDVVLTKDGEVLVTHDPVLNPDLVRDETGAFIGASKEAVLASDPTFLGAYIQKYAVKNRTLSDLGKFDVGRLNPASRYAKYFPDQVAVDGTRMPTLREVIRFLDRETNGKMHFQVEMKTDATRRFLGADPVAFAAAVAKVLREENAVERTEIQAFDFACLIALTKIDACFRTAFLTSRENAPGGAADFLHPDPRRSGVWTAGTLVRDHGGSIPKMVKALGGFAWEPEDASLTNAALTEARDLGLKVVVWSWTEKLGTAFDPEMTAKMIDLGVDGIITDDPARLNSMLAERGFDVPPRYVK